MDLDDVGDVQHPDRGRELIRSELLRRALAVPAFEQLPERDGDVGTETELVRQVRGRVAVRHEAALDHVTGEDLEQQPEAL